MAHRTGVRLGSFLVCAAIVAAAIGFAATSVRAAKATLTVYTAVEADDLKKYAARFNEDYPDIEIKWVRDSTGVITAKLLAEKANPQADVIWGLAATSLLVLKPEGMLMPYAPKGVERLDAQFRDKDNPPAWVGMDAWVAALCFNTVEAQKKNLPEAGVVEGPDQTRLQGHDRHAEPGLVGHGLSRRLELAPALRRDRGLEVHGRAPPEHRRVHALRVQAVHDGRRRRVPDRGRPSSSAPPVRRSRARRSTSCSRRKARAGTWKPPRS